MSKASKRQTVHVLCRKLASRHDEQSIPENLVFHDVNTGEIPVVSGVLFHLLSTLYAFVLGAIHQYDVVYSFQNGLIQGWVGSKAARARYIVGLQSVPVRQCRDFFQSRDGPIQLRGQVMFGLYSRYSLIIKTFLEDTTEVICLTKGIREVTETVYDIDLSDAHIIGMGIDMEKFSNEETSPSSSETDSWAIAYVGSISSIRGIDELIEAVAEIDHEVEVVLAGTGSDQRLSKLQARASELGVDDRIDWLGMVPHEEVPQLLHRADIAVSPLDDIESFRISFPAKLLEYMASLCVVVASDIPAHQQLIDDSENGVLYDGETDGLAEALATCIENEERHDELAQNARVTAETHSWEKIYQRHARVMFE